MQSQTVARLRFIIEQKKDTTRSFLSLFKEKKLRFAAFGRFYAVAAAEVVSSASAEDASASLSFFIPLTIPLPLAYRSLE